MKKKLLIATHSVFADGIKNAMELVTGEQNSVSTLCAYTNEKLLMRYVMTKN
jgi:fructoselysine and glucoselysine-specific PTS system IIA component